MFKIWSLALVGKWLKHYFVLKLLLFGHKPEERGEKR